MATKKTITSKSSSATKTVSAKAARKPAAKKTSAKKTSAKKTSAKKTSAKETSATKRPVASAKTPSGPIVVLSAEERNQHIALTAYLRAESRHFAPGQEEEDWLWAEQQVDRAAHLPLS